MPIRSSLHIDQLLSNIAVKYQNVNFIHDQVFPLVPVKKSSDIYRTYTKNWRIPETSRAAGALAKEHDFAVGTAPYVLERHALKSYIDDDSKDNFDLTDLEADATIELTEKIMMRKEKSCADLFTATSFSLGASLATADTWITGTAQPILVFDTAAATVIANGGVKPNYGIMPLATFNIVKNHTTVVDRIKYTSKEINVAVVAGLLGLPELLVPSMAYDTADLGAASSNASIWKDDFAFLGYKPANPGFYQLSSGYMFQKNIPMVKKWRDEERDANAVEVNCSYQFKIVASLTGYYINNTF